MKIGARNFNVQLDRSPEKLVWKNTQTMKLQDKHGRHQCHTDCLKGQGKCMVFNVVPSIRRRQFRLPIL